MLAAAASPPPPPLRSRPPILALTRLVGLVVGLTALFAAVAAAAVGGLLGRAPRGRARPSGAAVAAILRHPAASNIIVSEVSRVLFCPIPKAASTNWKYLLRKLDHRPDFATLSRAHSANTSGMRYLSDYSPAEARRLLCDGALFKFAFVRDPYQRLLSAYMDKMRNQRQDFTDAEYRAFLAAAFSWKAARTVENLRTAPRPSFRAFVVAIAAQHAKLMNAHWRPQTDLCAFHLIPYDFVGRMEYLHRDVAYVLHRLNKTEHDFPTHEQLRFPPSGATRELADRLFDSDLMLLTRAVYWQDFEQLGYP